jgi:hypothetical protein
MSKKAQIILLIGIVVGFVLIFYFEINGTGHKPTPAVVITNNKPEVNNTTHTIMIGAIEVLPKIYDDGYGSAYIVVNEQAWGGVYDVIANVMLQKKRWQQKFPNKQIIATAVVNSNYQSDGYPLAIGGLLISYNYEEREP